MIKNSLEFLVLPKCNKSQQHNIYKVCIDQDCKVNSFVCREICESLKGHEKCTFVEWEKLQERMLRKIENQTGEMKRIQEIVSLLYKEIREKINNQQLKFRRWIDNFGFVNEVAYFIESLREKNYEAINGSLLYKVDKLLSESYQSKKLQELRKQIDLVNSINENLCKQLEVIYLPIKFSKFTLFTYPLLKSKITNDIQTLVSFFKPYKISKIDLLFRASENNFLVSAFHEKCDNIPHTLTLIKTEFNKIIGGYTPLKWKSTNSWEWSTDFSEQTFIFSLSLKEKMKLKNPKYTICYKYDYGPSFDDIRIVDKANISQNWGNFPTSYNNGKYQNNQESWTKFTGQKKGHTFKILEWQVFTIQLKEVKT